ncbi:MAG: hypothetical protein MHMPM18_000327 [Marteilia pararefringens]
MADRLESGGGGEVEAQVTPIAASDETQAKQQQQQLQAATAMAGGGGEESSQDQTHSQAAAAAAAPGRSPNKQLTESQKRDHFAIQARVDEIVAKLMSKENVIICLSDCLLLFFSGQIIWKLSNLCCS